MSTEHHYDEYGPNPPGALHEHSDIDPAIGYNFAIWLAVAMVLSLGIVYGTFHFFEGQREAADVQQFPLAVGQEKEPPSPRLQTQPFKDVYVLKQGQNDKLETYGWADKANGIVHIPIERAMEITLEHGLPARMDGGNSSPMVVEDSSAGRTSARR
ncbi:MAG: hypothetical protein R2712_28250 [Vicinamibacterales bacterium]